MAKNLKIVFLSKFYGEVHRGAETYVVELSKRLSKNHQVDILKGNGSGDLSKILAGRYDVVIPTNGRTQAFKASLGRLLGGKYKLVISRSTPLEILAILRPNDQFLAHLAS